MAGGTPAVEISRGEKAVPKKLETRWPGGSPLRELGLARERADTWVRPYGFRGWKPLPQKFESGNWATRRVASANSVSTFSSKNCLRFNFAMIN